MNVEIGTGAADSGATLPVMGKDTWRRWLELDWIQQNRDKISYRTCAERLNGTKLDAERAMEAQALRSAASRHTLRAEADRAIQELQQQQAEMNAAANISISQESYSNHAQSCQLQEALRQSALLEQQCRQLVAQRDEAEALHRAHYDELQTAKREHQQQRMHMEAAMATQRQEFHHLQQQSFMAQAMAKRRA